jgi:hypothetical protein
MECGGWAVGGGLLAVFGLTRRSLPGVLMSAAGGAMIYRGVTGRNPLRGVQRLWSSICCEPPAGQTPSYQHDFKGRATQLPEDQVEEASMESFPASDPPAHTKTTSP